MIYRKQDINVYLTGSQKWEATTCVTIQYLLTINLNRMPFRNMENHTLLYPNSNDNIINFQVGYVLLNYLRINKTFRYQVNKKIYTLFGKLTIKFTNNSYNTHNNHVISLMIFY